MSIKTFFNPPHRRILKALEEKKPEAEVLSLIAALPEFDGPKKGGPVLLAAVVAGYAAVAKALLEKKSDPRYVSPNANMPLHAAKTVEMAALLVDAGAKVSDAPSRSYTPLRAYMYRDNALELVTYMLSKGADPNQDNGAALHRAAWLGKEELVRVLLAAGADPLLQSDEGSLYGSALRSGNLKTIVLIDAAIKEAEEKRQAVWDGKPVPDAQPKPPARKAGFNV